MDFAYVYVIIHYVSDAYPARLNPAYENVLKSDTTQISSDKIVKTS